MDSCFRGLPPSKRFKLLHPQDDLHLLPAKKRLNPHINDPAAAFAYCLPAKKRVWAPPPPSPLSSIKQQQEPQESKQDEEEDDGIVCSVCRSTDGDPTDPIVICDGCELMVHASCYGSPLVTSIPDGDWFCLRCESKTGKAAACCLCPVEDGAVKQTVDGKWAHIGCALLVPEVFFKEPEERNGIDCSRVPERRRVLVCHLCETRQGCAVECSEPGCELGFHVSCGLERGLCIEYREGSGGAVVAAFCEDHTRLWEKQQLTGKFKIVPRGGNLKAKKKA